MTKHVICMVGLPGAGKSVLAEKLRRCYPQQTVVLDDFSVIAKDENELYRQLSIARKHTIVIITDPMLIGSNPSKAREVVRQWFDDVEVGFVMFSNDVEQSCKNAAYRREIQGDQRLISRKMIEVLSQQYNDKEWDRALIYQKHPYVRVNTWKPND